MPPSGFVFWISVFLIKTLRIDNLISLPLLNSLSYNSLSPPWLPSYKLGPTLRTSLGAENSRGWSVSKLMLRSQGL